MIKNNLKLERFNKKLIKEENISFKEALLIFEALYKEAISLGVFRTKNILDGIEIDLRIAKAINDLI